MVYAMVQTQHMDYGNAFHIQIMGLLAIGMFKKKKYKKQWIDDHHSFWEIPVEPAIFQWCAKPP